MPSVPHEGLVYLLRSRPQLVPELLRETVCAALPRYTDVKVESADLTELQPAEYRADLVLSLSDGAPVLGLIVEVQLSIDQRKRFVWPAYVANLRARWRCPVCLLVICTDRKARWAEMPTPIGCTNMFTPRVLSLENVPEITDEADAATNPERMVLAAILHGAGADASKAARIAAVAEGVCAKLDADRSKLYLDLILNSLSEAARKELQMNMRPDGYEYKSDFARRYMAEGRAEGRAEMVTSLLNARFGPLSEEVKKQLASRSTDELGAIGVRLLTAATLQEALTPRS